MSNPRWDIPAPNYNREVNELIRIYKAAIRDVISQIETLSTYGKEKELSRQQMEVVLVELASMLGQLDSEAQVWVDVQIREAFIRGEAETLVMLGEAKTINEARETIMKASLTALAVQSIEALIADTFEDLLYANNKMKRETIKMIRAIVAEQMKLKAAQGEGRRSTRNAIVQALTKKELRERFGVEGNIAIIDKAGRRWKLETYAEMVTRTKMLQAHTEGTRIQSLERGVDLALISSHNATDACRQFEGQIISMNGLTEGFMTYDELRRSNLIFHPNCRHKLIPIRDISLLPPAVRARYEEGVEVAQSLLEKAKNKK